MTKERNVANVPYSFLFFVNVRRYEYNRIVGF